MQAQAAVCPFPVAPQPRIRADIYRFDALPDYYREAEQSGAGHFVLDAAFTEYLEQKLQILQQAPQLHRCYHCPDAEQAAGLAAALWQVLALFAQEQPHCLQADAAGYVLPQLGLRLIKQNLTAELSLEPAQAPQAALGQRIYAYLQQQQGLARLLDVVGLCMQEDIVIMRGTSNQATREAASDNTANDYAEALQVCFPSAWNPRSRLGQDFGAIHAPVAHSYRLQQAQPRVMQALLSKGPFLRFVWSISPHASLNHNPAWPASGYNQPASDDLPSLEQLYFRVERQTTCAFPALQRCMFSIRIFQQPLLEVVHNADRRQRLGQALQAMDAAHLRYKSLDKLLPMLLPWLES